MRPSKANGHGGAGCVTVFGKKAEGTAVVEGWKNRLELEFLSFTITYKINLKVRVKDDVEKIQMFSFSIGINLSYRFLYNICSS
jgi:hypothetical protein